MTPIIVPYLIPYVTHFKEFRFCLIVVLDPAPAVQLLWKGFRPEAGAGQKGICGLGLRTQGLGISGSGLQALSFQAQEFWVEGWRLRDLRLRV